MPMVSLNFDLLELKISLCLIDVVKLSECIFISANELPTKSNWYNTFSMSCVKNYYTYIYSATKGQPASNKLQYSDK